MKKSIFVVFTLVFLSFNINVISAHANQYGANTNIEQQIQEINRRLLDIENRLSEIESYRGKQQTSQSPQNNFHRENSGINNVNISDGNVNRSSVDYMFDQAFALLQQGNSTAAEEKFQDIVRSYPTEELSGEALYWLGEISFRRRDYKKASIHFLDSYTKFSNGNKAYNSLLNLSISLGLLGKVDKACLGFEDLIDNNNVPANIKSRANEELIKFGCSIKR